MAVLDVVANSDVAETEKQTQAQNEFLKLDPKGLPLNPQPSDYKDDPLNFPRWQKWVILAQIFYLALYSPLNTSLINPCFVLLASVFNVPTTTASYSTTLAILAVGWAPLIFTPLSTKYGRRPILLATNFAAIWLTIGTGLTNSWGALLALRLSLWCVRMFRILCWTCYHL